MRLGNLPKLVCTLTECYLKNLPNKEKIIIVLKLGNEPANKIAVFV